MIVVLNASCACTLTGCVSNATANTPVAIHANARNPDIKRPAFLPTWIVDSRC